MNKGGFNTFNMRIDKDLRDFLKGSAIKYECSMTSLVTRILEDFRKKIERKGSSSKTEEDFN